MNTSPRTSAARSSGQSQNGGNEARAGMPIRTAATRASWRRCTTALMKCVVPIITPSIRPCATSGCAAQRDERGDDAARSHPRVVGVLTAMDDPPVVEQHRIGVGAADIDPDPPHVTPGGGSAAEFALAGGFAQSGERKRASTLAADPAIVRLSL